jgi:glycosyltransferase involved in cell wall biosynthesis
MSPRVTVVIPFLNPGAFLADAIDSVMAQTFRQWEVVLVDDGSVDESVDIAHAAASLRPGQVRYIRHDQGKNLGMPASRNAGCAHARGEYISHLDADDVLEPSALARQVRILDENPCAAMTFGPMKVWRSWQGGEDTLQELSCPVGATLPAPLFVPLLLTGRNDPAGYLMRRTAFDAVGGYVEELGFCEDWALYVKVAMTFGIHVDSHCGYSYRQHAGQGCERLRQAGRFHDAYPPFFEWMRCYLRSERRSDAVVLQALAHAIHRNRAKRWIDALRRLSRRRSQLR